MLDELIKRGHLTALEKAFAEELGQSGDAALFIAYLLAASRLGSLCVEVTGQGVIPELPWTQDIALALRRGALALPKDVACNADSGLAPIVKDGTYFALHKAWRLERDLGAELARLLKAKPLPLDVRLPDGLLPEQRLAIMQAVSSPLSIITGGPGTGKTFVGRCILDAVKDTLVAAPTGKAAQRLGGQTLHRLLGLPRGSPASLNADLILVDEASMIDGQLMLDLLKRIEPPTRLVLMGDHYQLPPVEAGAPFAQMLDIVPKTTTLKTCLRTEKPKLAAFAESVREGLEDEVIAMLDSGVVGFGPLSENFVDGACLLSPFKQGYFGADAVNRRLLRRHERAWQSGEEFVVPILITENDPRLDLYNGDMGELVLQHPRRVASGDRARFADGREFSLWELPAYAPRYCLSVHKAQGSEFDSVCLLLPKGSELFGREILYTAVTRAKQTVTIRGERETLLAALKKRGCRHSALRKVLERQADPSSKGKM